MLIPKLLQKYEWLIEKAVHSKEMNDVKSITSASCLSMGK